MRKSVSINTRLKIQAEEIISHLMISNEELNEEIEAGVKAAFENMDISKMIQNEVEAAFRDAIKHSASWGKIRELVKQKSDELINKYVDSEYEVIYKKMFPSEQ